MQAECGHHAGTAQISWDIKALRLQIGRAGPEGDRCIYIFEVLYHQKLSLQDVCQQHSPPTMLPQSSFLLDSLKLNTRHYSRYNVFRALGAPFRQDLPWAYSNTSPWDSLILPACGARLSAPWGLPLQTRSPRPWIALHPSHKLPYTSFYWLLQYISTRSRCLVVSSLPHFLPHSPNCTTFQQTRGNTWEVWTTPWDW